METGWYTLQYISAEPKPMVLPLKIAAVSVLFYNPVKKMRVDEGQWAFLVYTGTGTVFLALNMDSKDIS
jgi:hypothetical protein